MGNTYLPPKPTAPPPAADASAAYFRELARLATDRQLRKSSGRGGAFTAPPAASGSGFETYRAPGTKTLLGS